MSRDQQQVRCFWDGEEVPEAEYLRRKFCICGMRNAPDRLMCPACLKRWRDAASKLPAAHHIEGGKS